MKYKKEAEIVEDNEIFSIVNTNQASKLTGINQGYLSKVRAGKIVPSEKWYMEFKRKLGIDKSSNI